MSTSTVDVDIHVYLTYDILRHGIDEVGEIQVPWSLSPSSITSSHLRPPLPSPAPLPLVASPQWP